MDEVATSEIEDIHRKWEERFHGDGSFCLHLLGEVCNRSGNWLFVLRALELAHALYEQLPGAMISLRFIELDLTKAKWLPEQVKKALNPSDPSNTFKRVVNVSVTELLDTMTRAESFSCIAMFESGNFNIDPDQLDEAIALCSEDSIFVAGILLSDPGIKNHGRLIKHIVGNVGHSGMVFMIPPVNHLARPLDDNPQLVVHNPYDQAITDSFKGTSLHLSFTSWKQPILWNYTGEIDQDLFLLETVVAVQHNGKWVADIRALDLERDWPDILEFVCDDDCAQDNARMEQNSVSIDSWEEMLDPPPCLGVFRAKGNWAARMAAATLLAQQGGSHTVAIVSGEKLCLGCLEREYEAPEPRVPELIIF